jgi:chromosomal replication initiator protein
VALFLCRKLLHLPYQTIGRIFNRDHSTVMTSIAQVEEAVAKKTSPYFEAVERVTFSTKN